jgi:hypothetical protein
VTITGPSYKARDKPQKALGEESLAHFPVVTVLGARQVGKSTLAQMTSSDDWPGRYRTLDDVALLDAALADPDGFVGGLDLPVILDEIQRAPDLLRSIKRVVDRDRSPGRFLLTGSANLLTMRKAAPPRTSLPLYPRRRRRSGAS